MPAESTHHVAGPLTVAVGLAATAGFVDAFVFQNVSAVFVANMSGNLIRVGMAVGDLDGHAVAASAIALVAFTLAAIAAATAIDRHVAGCRRCRGFVASYVATPRLLRVALDAPLPRRVQRALRRRLAGLGRS